MIYHIKKNNHYCEETKVQAHDQSTGYEVQAMIPEEWLENYADGIPRTDTVALAKARKLNAQSNKLEGRSWGLNHHQESVRTSFRPVFEPDGITPKDYFGVLAYYYNRGKCYQKFLFHVQPGETFLYEYEFIRSSNLIVWNSPKLKISKGFEFQFANVPVYGYELFLYHGGDAVATRDLTASIEKL